MNQESSASKRLFIEAVDAKALPEDPIIRDAFIRIWEKLKAEIFVWDSFKTDLPFEISKQSSSDTSAMDAYEQHQQDLRSMCFDEEGKRKRLDKSQHKQISKTGRFTVKSQIDESFDNVWLLGSLLQQGSESLAARFKKRRESALRHWFLYLPEYFSKTGRNSIVGALRVARNAIYHLFRLLFGLPEYRPRYTDSRISLLINKARIRYLLCGLTPDKENIHLWSIDEHKKLNTLLANPEVLEQIKIIIEQLKAELTEQGDNTDESLLATLSSHPRIKEIDAELPELIKNFHYFCLQLSALNPAFDEYYDAELERMDKQLIKQYPFRGRYKHWREMQLLQKDAELHQHVNNILATDFLAALSDGQNSYLLKQNLDFNEKSSEEIQSRLSVKMRLAKIFKLPVIQWSFRSLTNQESLPVVEIKLTTKSCCWRVGYYFMLTRMLLHNICLKLFRVLLHHPYGIKSVATLSKEKFNGETWLLDNGKPYKAKKYGTYLSDIDDTGKLIKKYRQQFEEKSDYGLFPRSVGRIFNLFFCYVIIGMAGIVFNLLFRVLAFTVIGIVSVLGVILAPFWVPAFTTLVFLFNLFIYDYIGPSPYFDGRKQKPYSAVMPVFNTLFNHMLLRGLLLTLVSMLSVIFHVFIVPVIYLFSFFAYVIAHLWDTLMRIVFIYPFARIPGDNFSGVITRIAGHGIATNILKVTGKHETQQKYQLWLQKFMLDIYESVTLKKLKSSEILLSKIMTPTYRKIMGDQISSVEKSVEENIEKYESLISENIRGFRKKLYSEQHLYRTDLVRLRKNELASFITDSETLCRITIEEHLIPWLSEAEHKLFWLNLGINENDWSLLNRVLLSQAFSADIFKPIEDCDGDISVEVEHKNIAKSLVTEKQPMSKISFNVDQQALFPKTENKLLFEDNDFWYRLHEGINRAEQRLPWK